MKMRPASTVVLSALALLAGCPDREVSSLDPEQSRVEQKNIPLIINNDVDILFVIDDSVSMDDEQASLRANFDRFIDVLDNIEGGLPDVHLGVASSNMGSLNVIPSGGCAGMGDNGLLHLGAAVIAGGDRYLSDVGGPTPASRITNYDQGGTVPLTTAFGQIADVGTTGCGFEQHLASMRAAFENPQNAAGTGGPFLRPGAHLAVVVLADEDDCSAASAQLFATEPAIGGPDAFRCFADGVECDQPDLNSPGTKTGCRPRDPSPYLHAPAEYVDFLQGLKPSPDQVVIVAGIVGDREPVVVETDEINDVDWPALGASCTYDNPDPLAEDQTADPAIRIGAFLDAFAGHGRQTTICDDDLALALEDVAGLIASELNSCLINALADTIPSTPELDYECSVTLTSGAASVETFADPIPECDAGQTVQPCWRFVPEPRCASYPTGLAFDIVRDVELPAGTRILASCVVL